MPLGSNHITTTTAASYIPDLWSMETVAAYKANTVLRSRVKLFNHKKKKGDTIIVPKFTRAEASPKVAGSQVTLTAATEGSVVVQLNKHYEYSKLLEDIVAIQALDSLRQMYTDDAGYALAVQVDFHLHVLGTELNGGTLDTTPGTPSNPTLTYGSAALIGGDGNTAWDPAANSNTGNGSNLTDAGIRRILRKLDDRNVPVSDRSIILPPSQKEVLLGINRFTEQAFQGSGAPIRTGEVGNIYGVPVFVSTLCGMTKAANNTTEYRACLFIHRDALVLAEQTDIRTQTSYKQEYLGDLFTADAVYGVATLHNDAGFAVIVPA